MPTRLLKAVLIVILLPLPGAHVPATAAPRPSGKSCAVTAMDVAKFWSLIERTLPFEADTQKQSEAMQKVLAELAPQEIEAFEVQFNQQLVRAYTWDLWGATYVVHGGASDDAFEYFRRWLISKGQRMFEHVLAKPDDLADLVAVNVVGGLEFEEFAYIPRDVWVNRTKKSPDDFACGDYPAYPKSGPTGAPFEEDNDALAMRYPKLWKRFGDNPLM